MASFSIPQIKASLEANSYPLRNSTILDTGSTIDVCNEISRFLNFKAATYGDFLYAGDVKVPILGYGDVDVQAKSPTGRVILRLHNVAYCPNFACNVVSFRKLQKQGLWWDTRQEYNCIRQQDGSILANLSIQEDQYVLEHIAIRHLSDPYTKISFFVRRRNRFNTYTQRRPARAEADLWHQRLGHPGPAVIEHLTGSIRGARVRGPITP